MKACTTVQSLRVARGFFENELCGLAIDPTSDFFQNAQCMIPLIVIQIDVPAIKPATGRAGSAVPVTTLLDDINLIPIIL